MAIAQTINFDRSLQRLQFIFRSSGLTFESKKLTQKKKLKLRCMYLFNFFWLNFDVSGGIYWFVDAIKSGKTFIELTYAAPCIVFTLLMNLKAIFLIRYEDNVSDLIENLRKLEAKDELAANDWNDSKTNKRIRQLTYDEFDKNGHKYDNNARLFKNIQENRVEKDKIRYEEVKFLHSVLKYSNILSVILILTFIASPLILMALKYYQTKEVELMLPFFIIYPFDSNDIRYWPFVYIHQFGSVCIVLLAINGTDNLLYICCTYLGVQFRLLRLDIEHVVEKNRVLTDNELEEFRGKCVNLIEWHQELIKLANLLEFIYSESTLFNFLSSSMLICLTGFNVIAIENVAFAVAFLVFLSASLLQVYMLCYFGDMLMRSSMDISDAVYISKWYYLNAKSAKNLLIVQKRALKPCKLTAFGFADVNLKAFMNVLRSAWSYFALLITVYTPRTD